MAKSDLLLKNTETIVEIIRGLRKSGKTEFDPTIRSSIMIAKTLVTLKTISSRSKVYSEKFAKIFPLPKRVVLAQRLIRKR